jgi:hypothetical protein
LLQQFPSIDREWRRGSLYKGDGEGVLVHGEKDGRG